jgi:hypothetical protein
MRSLLIFSTCLVISLQSTSLHAQSSSLNRHDSHYAKTGKWEHRDEQGKLTEEGTYRPVKVKSNNFELVFTEQPDRSLTVSDSVWISLQVGEWTYYDHLGRIREITYYDAAGVKVNTDLYHYDQDYTNVKYIERDFASYNQKSLFVSAGKDSVQFLETVFRKPIPAHEFVSIPVVIQNLSIKKNVIHVRENRRLNLYADTFNLGPMESFTYVAEINVAAGNTTDEILFSNGNWTFPFGLKVFAYDLATDDFLNPQKKVVPQSFYYLRQGDEYQLEIVRKDSDVRVLSLAREITRITLESGEYFFEIASPAGRKSKAISIR